MATADVWDEPDRRRQQSLSDLDSGALPTPTEQPIKCTNSDHSYSYAYTRTRYSERLINLQHWKISTNQKTKISENDKSDDYHRFATSGLYIHTTRPTYTSGSYATHR